MRVGAGLDAGLRLPFDELRQAGREAARLGFESLWTPAGGVPDAFHICAAWAEATSLWTGISVVPAARMWSPLALAAQAATVGLRSQGRFVLGLGTGGYGPGFWASVGLPDRPIAIMRDYLTTVRALLAGETVTYDGPGCSSPRRLAWRIRSASRARSSWARSGPKWCAWRASWPTGPSSTGPRRSESTRAGAWWPRGRPGEGGTRTRWRSPCTSGSVSTTTWPQLAEPSAPRSSATPWPGPAPR